MSHLSIYRLKQADGFEFVLNIQHNFLNHLNSRMVIPLYPYETYIQKAVTHLNPIIKVSDIKLIAMTQYMSAIHVNHLGEIIGNTNDQYLEITNALDFLFQGF